MRLSQYKHVDPGENLHPDFFKQYLPSTMAGKDYFAIDISWEIRLEEDEGGLPTSDFLEQLSGPTVAQSLFQSTTEVLKKILNAIATDTVRQVPNSIRDTSGRQDAPMASKFDFNRPMYLVYNQDFDRVAVIQEDS